MHVRAFGSSIASQNAKEYHKHAFSKYRNRVDHCRSCSGFDQQVHSDGRRNQDDFKRSRCGGRIDLGPAGDRTLGTDQQLSGLSMTPAIPTVFRHLTGRGQIAATFAGESPMKSANNRKARIGPPHASIENVKAYDRKGKQ